MACCRSQSRPFTDIFFAFASVFLNRFNPIPRVPATSLVFLSTYLPLLPMPSNAYRLSSSFSDMYGTDELRAVFSDEQPGAVLARLRGCAGAG